MSRDGDRRSRCTQELKTLEWSSVVDSDYPVHSELNCGLIGASDVREAIFLEPAQVEITSIPDHSPTKQRFRRSYPPGTSLNRVEKIRSYISRLYMETMSTSPVLRSKSHAKGVQEAKRIETANSLNARDFFYNYYTSEARDSLGRACNRHLPALKPIFRDAEGIEHLGFLEACFDLIEETSAADYNNSETKWSSHKKKKEMLLPDMKYIVLLDSESFAPDDPETLPVAGFVSFMMTYEDNHEVAYIYEIHFEEKWRRFGLGKELMAAVEAIGRTVGVEKSMLTVFKANEGAISFYQRLGYSEDEYSPSPRELRNGTIKEPTYTLLSKKL